MPNSINLDTEVFNPKKRKLCKINSLSMEDSRAIIVRLLIVIRAERKYLDNILAYNEKITKQGTLYRYARKEMRSKEEI